MNVSESCPDASDILIAAIYDGLGKADPWAEALEHLRVTLNANVACLRISQRGRDPKENLFAAGPRACPEAIAEWEQQKARDLLPIEVKLGEVRMLHMSQMDLPGAMLDLVQRYDVGASATACIDASDATQTTLHCVRSRSLPAFSADELDFLKLVGAHFARAMRLRAEVTSARIVSEFQADALDRMAVAAILVEKSQRVVLLNRAAREHIDRQDGLRLVNGRLHAVDGHEDRGFQVALRDVLSGTNGVSRAMSLSRKQAGRNVGVVINGRDTLSLVSNRPEKCALIFVRSAEIVNSDDMVSLQQLFSFTKAEAKLAIGLAKGMRLEDVESELNIRHNTARAHLRSMFLKADVNRQSELIHLLANSVAPLGRDHVAH